MVVLRHLPCNEKGELTGVVAIPQCQERLLLSQGEQRSALPLDRWVRLCWRSKRTKLFQEVFIDPFFDDLPVGEMQELQSPHRDRFARGCHTHEWGLMGATIRIANRDVISFPDQVFNRQRYIGKSREKHREELFDRFSTLDGS